MSLAPNTTDPHQPTPDAPPGASLIALVRWIVPGDRRDEWQAEWIGELGARWRFAERAQDAGPMRRLALIVRAAGAVSDALWMRRRYGGDPMLSHDLRQAIRSLSRRPVFSLVVILTLALGIGANAAIFSVVNTVLLRPLPFRDPSSLVMVFGMSTDGDTASLSVGRSSSFPDYADIRDQQHSFAQLAAYMRSGPALTAERLEPSRVQGATVTWNIFPAVGAKPLLGRTFAAADDQPGAPHVTLLSYGLWQSRFNGDRGVLGRVISLDGVPHTIVGVMPRDWSFPSATDLWTPIASFDRANIRGVHSFYIIGRLKDGVTVAAAEQEVRTIAKRLEAQYPQDNLKRGARLQPLRETVVQNVRPALAMLAGAVVMVMLIVCTNLANLFLSRAASREREAAVRTALGAGRGQLVRQLLTESVLLAVLGGIFGVLLAHWGVQAIVAEAPLSIPRASEIGIDGTVLAFIAGVSLLAGLAFGLVPAWQYSRSEVLGALRDAGRGSSGRMGQRLRQGLVVAEVALAVVLVIGAGLLIKSFVHLQRVDVGFNPEKLLAVQVDLPQSRYRSSTQRLQFFERLQAQVAALPGVKQVAVSLEHPLSSGWTTSFAIREHEPPRTGESPEARVRPVSAGYFHMMGIPIRRGRDIAPQDIAGAPGVVVINEAFAKQHFPNEDPIGKHVHRQPWWPEMPTDFEIVGIAADEKFLGLQAGADPATYFAFPQFTLAQYVTVRAAGDPKALIPAIREQIWSLDRALPVDVTVTMDDAIDDQLAGMRFNAALLGIFAGIALVLAALGVYGVLSYTVAQRTSEMGIRMALGAQRGAVVRLVVGQGLALTGIGIVIGLAASFGATRAITRLLYQVSALDPLVFVTVGVLLALVACAAAYLPARRASRVDPLVAMRPE